MSVEISEMMRWFRANPSTVIAVAGTLASTMMTALAILRHKRHMGVALKFAQEVEFHDVVKSNSLEKLGGYLDSVLGNFLISEYVEGTDVQRKVDESIRRIREYVEAPSEGGLVPRIAKSSLSPSPNAALADPYDKILTEIRSGEVWNGLARLRREIEMRLRAVAENRDIVIPDKTSVGKLISILEKAGALNDQAALPLRYATQVAGRAIHGEDVSADIAEGALFEAVHGLQFVRFPSNG